jgi:GMP synthase PP-ATPase subunit
MRSASFFGKLVGVADPEAKRRNIGREFGSVPGRFGQAAPIAATRRLTGALPPSLMRRIPFQPNG